MFIYFENYSAKVQRNELQKVACIQRFLYISFDHNEKDIFNDFVLSSVFHASLTQEGN